MARQKLLQHRLDVAVQPALGRMAGAPAVPAVVDREDRIALSGEAGEHRRPDRQVAAVTVEIHDLGQRGRVMNHPRPNCSPSAVAIEIDCGECRARPVWWFPRRAERTRDVDSGRRTTRAAMATRAISERASFIIDGLSRYSAAAVILCGRADLALPAGAARRPDLGVHGRRRRSSASAASHRGGTTSRRIVTTWSPSRSPGVRFVTRACSRRCAPCRATSSCRRNVSRTRIWIARCPSATARPSRSPTLSR